MEVPYPLSDAFLGKISFKLAHIWSPGDTFPLLFILYLDKTQAVQVNPSAVASLSLLCSHTSGSPGSSDTSTVCFPTLGTPMKLPEDALMPCSLALGLSTPHPAVWVRGVHSAC